MAGCLLDSCFAQQPNKAAESGGTQLELVLRVSEDYLRTLTKTEVHYSFPVSRTVDGMQVTGHVEATGTTRLEILPSPTRADFVISVHGTASSQFAVHAGPATVLASSSTLFTSQKRFSFDGVDYDQHPATAETDTCTRIGRICPRHGGIIGNVVKKVGRRIANRNWSDINQEVDRTANEYVVDKFEESATELDRKLDQLSEFDETVAIMQKHFPELADAQYHLAANDEFLLAGLGPPDASFPELPPMQGKVELWLKTRPIEAAFLQIVVDWDLANDLLREYLPADEARKISDDITVETKNGWTVLRVGSVHDEFGESD